jgi:hypothetical protein
MDPIVEPIDVVVSFDPALDHERMDVEIYARERDPLAIAERPGMTAVRWRCRPLTAAQFAQVDSASSINWKITNAFAFGCSELINAPSPGMSIRPDATIPNGRGGEMKFWDDTALERIRQRYSLAAIYEVGSFIYERSLLVGNAWGGGVTRYTLPQSSRDALERIERLRAESIRRNAATKTSAPQGQSSAPTSEQSSGAATDATAQVSSTHE